jgi:hypothetical protein
MSKSSVFANAPDCVQVQDLAVMQRSTVDELPSIQKLWPAFEELVGLRGRKMFAYVDERARTYTVCTPVRPDDPADRFGLELGTLPGGWYLRGRLRGDPSRTYAKIGTGMTELKSLAPVDETRPLVEFYRRHDVIDLYVPIKHGS